MKSNTEENSKKVQIQIKVPWLLYKVLVLLLSLIPSGVHQMLISEGI